MLPGTNIKNKVTFATSLLYGWLEQRASFESLEWLNQKGQLVAQGEAKVLYASYSAVPRYFGKEILNLSGAELDAAGELIPGWNPVDWTIDQVGRTILLLSFESEDSDRYFATLDKIVAVADMRETVAFYQSLPLLPHPEKFQLRAAEGIRTNMTSVFNAVALNNPYPARHLNDLAWNQMVLKALFVGSPLQPIYGLERRNNQQLCQMLIDYACERLAANRSVSSELWSLVKVFNPETVAKLRSSAMTA